MSSPPGDDLGCAGHCSAATTAGRAGAARCAIAGGTAGVTIAPPRASTLHIAAALAARALCRALPLLCRALLTHRGTSILQRPARSAPSARRHFQCSTRSQVGTWKGPQNKLTRDQDCGQRSKGLSMHNQLCTANWLFCKALPSDCSRSSRHCVARNGVRGASFWCSEDASRRHPSPVHQPLWPPPMLQGPGPPRMLPERAGPLWMSRC
jgi:hypothetical protein